MRAVVVCLNTTCRIGGVDVKGIQMSAYGFDGPEALTIRDLSVEKSHWDEMLRPVQLPLLSPTLGFSW